MEAQAAEVLDFFELGRSVDMVTKSELLEAARSRGVKISDRNLTYYTSEGLLPRSVRVGSRAGAYPIVVVELLTWVVRSRDRGLSLDGIRELLPLWKALVRARKEGHVDLAEAEYISRQTVHSSEANFAVPWVVSEVFAYLCPECAADVVWCLKDGSTASMAAEDLRLTFLLTELDDDGKQAHTVAWTQLVLPGIGAEPDLNDPAMMILGAPNGVPVAGCMSGHSLEGARSNSTPDRRQEVSTL
jgi:DNA-binding transcriptional MerR regulator